MQKSFHPEMGAAIERPTDLPIADRDKPLEEFTVFVALRCDHLAFANSRDPGQVSCTASQTTSDDVLAGNPVGSMIISPVLLRYSSAHTPLPQSIYTRMFVFMV